MPSPNRDAQSTPLGRIAVELATLRTALETEPTSAERLILELETRPELATRLREALEVTDPNRLYTCAEMAPRLNAHAKTVERWCRDGRIPEARKVGRTWMMPSHVTVAPKRRNDLGSPETGRRSSRRRPDAGDAVLDALLPERRRRP